MSKRIQLTRRIPLVEPKHEPSSASRPVVPTLALAPVESNVWKPVHAGKLVAQELPTEHLADNLQRDAIVLVKAAWCPHCTQYLPEFRRFAPNLPVSTVIVEVGNAKEDKHQRQFLEKYKISGFPTLLLLKANGTSKVLVGPQTEQDLKSQAAAFF